MDCSRGAKSVSMSTTTSGTLSTAQRKRNIAGTIVVIIRQCAMKALVAIETEKPLLVVPVLQEMLNNALHSSTIGAHILAYRWVTTINSTTLSLSHEVAQATARTWFRACRLSIFQRHQRALKNGIERKTSIHQNGTKESRNGFLKNNDYYHRLLNFFSKISSTIAIDY